MGADSLHRWLLIVLGGAGLFLDSSNLSELDSQRAGGTGEFRGHRSGVDFLRKRSRGCNFKWPLWSSLLSGKAIPLPALLCQQVPRHLSPREKLQLCTPAESSHRHPLQSYVSPWPSCTRNGGGRVGSSQEDKVLVLSNFANIWRQHCLPAKGVAPRSGRKYCNWFHSSQQILRM